MTSICTSRDFVGFKDPYTGEPLQVVIVVSRLGVRYQVKGAYSLMTPYKTRAEAVSAWSRVDGVVGLRNPSGGFFCAYTGKPIVPYVDEEGHKFSGGFIPEQLRTRDEILKILNHTAGREYVGTNSQRVDAVTEQPPLPRSQAPDINEYAERAAANTLYDNGVRPSTKVSFAVTKRKGSKK